MQVIDGRLPPGIRTELSGPDSSPVATEDEDRSSNVDDEIGLDRRWANKQINRYSRRSGIETAYSKIKEFAP